MFRVYDEVYLINQDKHGIVIDYDYMEYEDMYRYSVDCEEDLLECRENELRLV
jgi:hypothetical protein